MFNDKNIENNDKKEYDEMIWVQFKKLSHKTFCMSCLPYETVSDLIQRYRMNAKDNENAN